MIDVPHHSANVGPIEYPFGIERKVARDPGKIPGAISHDTDFVRIVVSAVLQEFRHLIVQSLGARHGGCPDPWLFATLA
ncbi:hypothetical protein C2U69_14475 [Cupriavidus pinatubonensis]|nr:hypothetical protein C2U69_14475 [Cupriavidus pinatubonensis]